MRLVFVETLLFVATAKSPRNVAGALSDAGRRALRAIVEAIHAGEG